MRKVVVTGLKLAVSLGILSFLVYQARQDDTFVRLRDEPKHWGFFAAAWALCAAAVCCAISRWFLLVRALELPFRLRDAFRLGSLCYMLNFVSLGSVGGDLFKAVFLAREHPGNRTAAVATVVVDRTIGLFVLVLVASAGVLWTGQAFSDVPEIRVICRGTLVAALGFATALGLVLTPGFSSGPLAEFVEGLRYVGPVAARVFGAVRMYRRRWGVLAIAAALSVGVHSLNALGLFCIAQGLPGPHPSLSAHFVIVPLAMVAGALPLPLAGLGALEGVLDFLYQYFPSGVQAPPGQGLLVAIGYRAISVLIAAVGAVVWLTSRREMNAAFAEAQAEQAAA